MIADRSFISLFERRPGAAPAQDFRVGMACATATRAVVDYHGLVIGWDPGYLEISRYDERVAGPEAA